MFFLGLYLHSNHFNSFEGYFLSENVIIWQPHSELAQMLNRELY